MTNIGIIGCGGAMGKALVREVHGTPEAKLVAGSEWSGSGHAGKDIGTLAGVEPLGIAVTDDTRAVLDAADVVIDFTAPAATMEIAQLAEETGTTHIIGTTGLSDEQRATIQKNTSNHTVVQAHNFSVGVNLLLTLIEKTAATLPADMFDIEVVEMHHNRKVDAPSGTALSMGEAAAAGRGVALDDVATYERYGQVGARETGEIGFATLRGGDVVGDHTVMFASPLERIELTHKAQDRRLFAHGAVRAALWSVGKEHGFYTMQDVLGL